jgi:subtilisin family serine protease
VSRKSFALVAGCLAVLLQVTEASAERYLVAFKNKNVGDATAGQTIAAAGGQMVRNLPALGVTLASSDDPAFASRLAAVQSVRSVRPDVMVEANQQKDGEHVQTFTEEQVQALIANHPGMGHLQAPPSGAFMPPFVSVDTLENTFFRPIQWDLDKIDMSTAWAAGYTGDPQIKVAVISTGIDYEHLDMQGRVDLELSKNFVPEDKALVQALWPGKHEILDLGLHGTYTASLISCNAFVFSCDTPNIDLIGLKWLNFEEQGRIGDLVSAIDYAVDIGVHVIALPDTLELFDIELDQSDPAERADLIAVRRAVRRAEANNVLVFAAAWTRRNECGINADGNGSLVHFPGQIGATTVGATGLQDQWSAESSYGNSLIDIAGPGGEIDPVTCTVDPNLYIYALGVCSGFTLHVTPRNNFPEICNQATTPVWIFSFGVRPAVAHAVSTAVVLLQRYGVGTSAHFIRQKMFQTADDVITPGYDPWSGHGRVNAGRAATE